MTNVFTFIGAVGAVEDAVVDQIGADATRLSARAGELPRLAVCNKSKRLSSVGIKRVVFFYRFYGESRDWLLFNGHLNARSAN